MDFETLERRPTPACHYFQRVAQGRVLVAPDGLHEEPVEPGVSEAQAL